MSRADLFPTRERERRQDHTRQCHAQRGYFSRCKNHHPFFHQDVRSSPDQGEDQQQENSKGRRFIFHDRKCNSDQATWSEKTSSTSSRMAWTSGAVSASTRRVRYGLKSGMLLK